MVLAPCRAAPDSAGFFDLTVGDLQGDLQQARAQGKLGLLVMFEMDDCPYCRRMKETVFTQAEVKTYFRQRFVILAVDVMGDVPLYDPSGHETREKDFARAMRATATPTFVFFDLEGRAVVRHVGATRDAREFMLLGRYVADGVYKTKSFTDYLRGAS